MPRPSKYNDGINRKAEQYIQNCEHDKEIPFVEELAYRIGVNDDTLVEWSRRHEEFSATLGRLKMLQRLELKRGALQKKLQPHIAVFLLKANHGMHEQHLDPLEPIRVIVKNFGNVSND